MTNLTLTTNMQANRCRRTERSSAGLRTVAASRERQTIFAGRSHRSLSSRKPVRLVFSLPKLIYDMGSYLGPSELTELAKVSLTMKVPLSYSWAKFEQSAMTIKRALHQRLAYTILRNFFPSEFPHTDREDDGELTHRYFLEGLIVLGVESIQPYLGRETQFDTYRDMVSLSSTDLVMFKKYQIKLAIKRINELRRAIFPSADPRSRPISSYFFHFKYPKK